MFHEYPKHINHPDGTFTVVKSADEETALLGPAEPVEEATTKESPEGEV